MRITLEKSFFPLQGGAKSELHIISSTSPSPLGFTDDASIFLLWQGKPPSCQASLHIAGTSTPLKSSPAIDFPGVFIEVPTQFSLPTLHAHCVEYDTAPFWKGCTFSQSLVSIPTMGMLDGRWCDGWIAHLSEKGRVHSLIAPGSAARLTIKLPVVQEEAIEWDEAMTAFPSLEELQRQSLVTMLISQYKAEELRRLSLTSFGLREAVYLLILRQAFPFAPMTAYHVQEPKQWPARFKNFLESIQTDWYKGTEGRPASSFFGKVSEEKILKLVPELNEKTRILAGIKR
ncbi:MAG: hypothetical protein HYW48_00645 [Deltaproteobacteria bacterium]|nr:hypothetical protein [Deltaproteobacteria bacterium]